MTTTLTDQDFDLILDALTRQRQDAFMRGDQELADKSRAVIGKIIEQQAQRMAGAR